MKLFKISLKNVYMNWWRSLTLGSLIFVITLLLVIFGSVFNTIESNMRTALSNSLTGDILIRSAADESRELFSLKGNSWGDESYLNPEQVKLIETIIQKDIRPVDYTQRVRLNAMVISDFAKKPAMMVGIDPRTKAYQKTFQLTRGRYLQPGSSNEILLTETQANQLKVNIGDTLGILAQSIDGYSTDAALKVVGIGNLELLSSFMFPIVYVDLKSAQDLMVFANGEVSDMILYVSKGQNPAGTVRKIQSLLDKASGNKAQVKVFQAQKLGGFIMGSISIYVMMFYSFIVILLLVVGILIINLIFMMGLERRQEIGTLKAIGFSRLHNIFIFMSEIMMVSGAACILGMAAGTMVVVSLSNIGLTVGAPMDMIIGKQFFLRFNLGNIITPICIVLGFTFVASFYPSYVAGSLKPAEAFKED